ncbi:hypothetical protein D3C75_912930 [compost metagenome]
MGVDGARPHGKAHVAQGLAVAHARVDHQAAHAAGLERGRQQVAEIAIAARRAGRHHQYVAWAALLHGNMEHPVVAWGHQHGYRAAGHRHTLLDRAHGSIEQPLATLGLMHRGDTQPAQGIDQFLLDARDITYHDAGLSDQPAHARFSVTRGNTLCRPSA